jgi:predicted RNase H-like HicB family nuclease
MGMIVRLLVEFDLRTKRWSAVFPELPGCASAGDTEEEAIANANKVLSLWCDPEWATTESAYVRSITK